IQDPAVEVPSQLDPRRVRRVEGEHDTRMGHRRWQGSFGVVVLSGGHNVGEGDPLSVRAPGVLLQDLCGECLIILIACAVPGIVSDGQAVAGGLSQLDAVSDDRRKVPAAEVTADLIHDRPDKRRPARVQREEHSGCDPMPGLFLQRVKSLQLLSETVEGEEAGIHGHDRFRASPCEPASELHIAETWYRGTALEDLLALPAPLVNDDRLYRALDRLVLHKTALERHLVARLGELFALDYDLLLYDVTSIYFEGVAEANPLARRGHSRDHR